jgi:hypothetical protein
MAALSTITKLWKQLRCPITDDKWVKKMCFLHTLVLYSAIKKNGIMLFAGKWMEMEKFVLKEISQAQKFQSHMLFFKVICGSLTYNLNVHIEAYKYIYIYIYIYIYK